LHTTLRRAAFGMVAAAVLVTGAVVAVPDDGKKAAPPSVPGGVSRALAAANSGSPASLPDLKAMIGDRQSWVGTHPSDARSWAVLGTAYVEWGRRSADAAYYGRAEQALRRSLDAQPGDRGNTAALVGLAALANARHDFVTAKKWGETVRARQPKDWTAYPVLIDAYDGLGEYTAAGTAAEKFTALRSGVPALSRTAQMYRNQGRRADALATAQNAADRATAPAEKADCLHRLGELAWERGESEKAVAQYSAALRTDPAHHPSLAGRARALAALGRTDEAQRDYRAALSRLPRPEYMLELGELYESLGRDDDSRNQYDRLRKSLARADGYGVDDALLLGRFEADHGNAATAVRLLKTKWQRRHHSAAVADTLGWALHRSGDSASALQYAQKAVDTGGGTALYAYHLGVIEESLREYAPARRHLEEALRTNAQFSPLAAPEARKALDALSPPSATGPRDVQPTPGPDHMAAGPDHGTHAPAGATSPAPGGH
jgi:tetratricopeptide (TPR) repeat protein